MLLLSGALQPTYSKTQGCTQLPVAKSSLRAQLQKSCRKHYSCASSGPESRGHPWAQDPSYILLHIQITQLVEHLSIGWQGPFPEYVDRILRKEGRDGTAAEYPRSNSAGDTTLWLSWKSKGLACPQAQAGQQIWREEVLGGWRQSGPP